MSEYRRPFRASYHLAWFVVDADDRIVAGGFDSAQQAWDYIDKYLGGSE